MREYETRLPFCEDLKRYLADRKSTLLSCPRATGQGVLFDYASGLLAKLHGASVIRFTLSDFEHRDSRFWDKLGESLANQVGFATRQSLDSIEFQALTTETLAGLEGRVFILVSVSGPDYAEAGFELVSILHRTLGNLSAAKRGEISIIILDDYSLYFFEKLHTGHNSLWDTFYRCLYTCFSKREWLAYWKEVSTAVGGLSKASIAAIGERAYALTGGHYGLTLDLLRDLERRKWEAPKTFWDDEARRHLGRSPAIESLKNALDEAPQLVDKALEFMSPNVYSIASDGLDQYLRRLGVLRADAGLSFVLCDGIMRDLLLDYAKGSRPRYSKSRASPADVIGRIRDLPEHTEDDITVIHLSDVHLGGNFPYRLSDVTGSDEPDRLSLPDKIRDDLEKIGLLGKIDALVISGDFTETGRMDEFFRAREFVDNTLKLLGLNKSQLLLIGGNHDVTWEPGTVAIAGGNSQGNKERLGAFFELLSKGKETATQHISVTSVSKKRVLRLLALDSNFVESEQASGIGYVSPDTITDAERLVRTFQKEDKLARRRTGDAYLWLVTHHHIFPVLDAPTDLARRGKVTIMASAAGFLRAAKDWGAEAILHGHEHQPSITVASRWASRDEMQFFPIACIGAGSVGVAKDRIGPFARNHYFVLRRTANGLIIRSRMIGDTALGFVKHADLRISLRSG